MPTSKPPRFWNREISQGNPNTQGKLHIGDVVLRNAATWVLDGVGKSANLGYMSNFRKFGDDVKNVRVKWDLPPLPKKLNNIGGRRIQGYHRFLQSAVLNPLPVSFLQSVVLNCTVGVESCDLKTAPNIQWLHWFQDLICPTHRRSSSLQGTKVGCLNSLLLSLSQWNK